jgi:hypothetical protein
MGESGPETSATNVIALKLEIAYDPIATGIGFHP